MVYDFSDGVACVVDKVNGKAGVIDMQGKYIIEPKYNSLRPCKGGLFETKDDNQNFFYINKNGEKNFTTLRMLMTILSKCHKPI